MNDPWCFIKRDIVIRQLWFMMIMLIICILQQLGEGQSNENRVSESSEESEMESDEDDKERRYQLSSSWCSVLSDIVSFSYEWEF